MRITVDIEESILEDLVGMMGESKKVPPLRVL